MTDRAREIAHAATHGCEGGELGFEHDEQCNKVTTEIVQLMADVAIESRNPPPMMKYEDGKVTAVYCAACGAPQ